MLAAINGVVCSAAWQHPSIARKESGPRQDALFLTFFCPILADSCSYIKSVGEPVTHNSRYYHEGVWMKDPLGILGTETIFVMEYFRSKNVLEEFENMDKFKAGVTRKTYKLPYNWDGTGAVVYGPYLYYNRYKF